MKRLAIEAKWKELRSELTPEQAHDGRKIFFCGVLLVLAWISEEGGVLQLEQIDDLNKQIKKELGQ